MTHYEPGPDGPAVDSWPTHVLGTDAPKHRLAEDAKRINGQD